MSELIFIFSVGMIGYIYFGYPALVLVLGRILGKPVRKSPCEPYVTVVISAFNEENCIRTTVENKLNLDYPADKLEIIVVSDGSTDKTEDEVTSIGDPRVRLVVQQPRCGKTAALNMAVPLARGSVIVFSDANSIYDPMALRSLTRNFADSTVGYVTGKMIYTFQRSGSVAEACSTYMKYENFLRERETRLGSIVGVDGGIDAVRKELYSPMRPDQLPDFVLPMSVVEQGFRVVYEPEAVLREPALEDPKDEYRMRVRVALRALWALLDHKTLLNPIRYGVFSWQLVSHKWLRYVAFSFLLTALIANGLCYSHGPILGLLFISQVGFYTAQAVLFTRSRLRGKEGRLDALFYPVLVNMAFFHAFIKFVMGRKITVWVPRKGTFV